jgi:hypothetical protein
MKTHAVLFTSAAVLCAWMLAPAGAEAARRGFNLSISDGGSAETCADLKVSSSNGEIAKLNEAFTMTRAEAPLLEMAATGNAHVHVRGSNRADYSVEVCKVAVAGTQAEAAQLVRSISAGHTAGRLTFNGPAPSEDSQWTAVFLVHAPKDARLDLETSNGPIEVRDIDGVVKLRATNGPVAIRNCGGNVDVQSQNGPIAFTGDRGDVRLNAQNGPIALNLSTEAWNGAQLEARTVNGPVAVSLPDGFRTGVRLETSLHSPLACSSPLCRNAFRNENREHSTLQMNGASDTVRISTENGPVSIHSEDRKNPKTRNF